MEGLEAIQIYDETRHREVIRAAHLFVVLDNSSPERLGRLLPDVKASGAFRICIDHHVTVDPFWNLNCIDTDAAASGQLVYEAIKALGGTITAPVAVALYAAFVTDTGHFRFPKTTPHVHRIIAELMEAGGINPQRIYRAVYEGHTRGLTRIVGLALSDAHYDYDGRFAWARLTRRQLEECNGFEEDTGDLVNMLLAVEGVQAAALFKELPEGRTKVSLRSLGDVDVNRLAGRFGGGGHKNASGVVMTAAFEEGVRSIVEGMREALDGR
jgi:phosphoesterase RecJ-like protein